MAESLRYRRMSNFAIAAFSIATLVILTSMIGYLVGIDVLDVVNQILDLASMKIHEILFT